MCFSITHFMEEVFLKSDTSMVVLSALPIDPAGSPMSAELMDETRLLAEALCHDERVLLHAQALPNVGDLAANLDAMAATAERYPIAAWKIFTNYPDLWDGSNNAWRLDDGDPELAPVGNAFVDQCVAARRADHLRPQGLLAEQPARVTRRLRAGRRRPSRREVRRLPLGLRPGSRPKARTTPDGDTGVNRLIASMQAQRRRARTRTCTPSWDRRGGR